MLRVSSRDPNPVKDSGGIKVSTLLGQDAQEPLSIRVQELEDGAVDSRGEILPALGVQVHDRFPCVVARYLGGLGAEPWEQAALRPQQGRERDLAGHWRALSLQSRLVSVTEAERKTFDDALALSEEERLELAEALFDSLSVEDQARIDQAWRTEILRRMKEVGNGEVELESWEEVRQAGREALARR